MTRQQSPRAQIDRYQLAALIVMLLGFTLRVYRIDAQALSGDEAFSIINWTRRPITDVFASIALIDPQPPATLLSLIGWVRLVGDSVFAARMLSALANTLALAIAFTLAKRLATPRVAVIATLILASTPFQIYYAQDIRSYSLWITTSALALLTFIRALDAPQHRGRWVAYILATTLSIYTFYLELFFLLVQYTYVLIRRRRDRKLMVRWVISQAAIGILLAPWFLQPSLRNSGYQPTGTAANLPWAYTTLLFGETIPATLNTTLLTVSTHAITIASIVALSLLALLVIALRRARLRHNLLILLYAIVPTLLLALLAQVTGRGYFRPRYIAASSMPLIIGLSATLDALLQRRATSRQGRGLRQAVASAALALLVIINAATLWTYHFAVAKAPPWPAIVERLHRQLGQDAILVRNFPDPAFDYYYAGDAPVVLLPTFATSTPESTAAELQQLFDSYTYLWFMPVEGTSHDPEQIVAQWLWANAQLISRQTIDHTPLLQFALPASPDTRIQHPAELTLATIAEVRGYRTTPDQVVNPGETLFIEVFWKPERQTETSLITFVNLQNVDVDSVQIYPLITESLPQSGRATTQTWTQKQLFREVYTLDIPEDTSSGSYRIEVGLYDADAGQSPNNPTAAGTLGTIDIAKQARRYGE